MKFVARLLIALIISPVFASPALAESPVLVAKMSSLSTSQCRRGSTSYEIRIGGIFELENQSQSTLLVSKKIDMVLSVVAASSEDDAKQGKYVFTMNQVFGGDAASSPARLQDFMVLKRGEKGTAEMDTVLSIEKMMEDTQTSHIRPGKYWFQFGFSTLPSSFSGHLDDWREKWKRIGTLTSGPFLTRPFPVGIVLDDNAKACDAK